MERREKWERLDSSAGESAQEKWEGLNSSAERASAQEKWEDLDLNAERECLADVRASGLKCPVEVGGSTLRHCEEEEGVGLVDLWPIFIKEYYIWQESIYTFVQSNLEPQ